jgi:hypothetical protein
MHVCHHIVTSFLFFESSNFKLRCVQMLLVRWVGITCLQLSIIRTRFCFISSIAASEMGRPSCFSAVASVSQSCRHVWKRFYDQNAETTHYDMSG